MARLNDTQRAALGYWWNLISDAARAGNTASETVQLASMVAADFGATIGFRENQAIATLYGYVRREINASNVFQAAQPGQAISGDMISVPPYARDEAEMATYPLYHVKFQYTYIDAAGNTQVTIKTDAFPDTLPETACDLAAAVEDDAIGMALKYGHTLVSAVPLAILAV